MKNQIESIKAKLKEVSKTNNKAHQLTLIRYFQERFLFRLSKSTYRNHFYLKGGVLIYALEGQLSRPTLDLDLLGQKITSDKERMLEVFKSVCASKYESDGITFDSEKIEVSEIIKEGNYQGLRMKLSCSLGNIRQKLQIDIGFGDVVIPGPVEIDYPSLLDMEMPRLFAYSIESLIAEKFEAMIDLAELNSRMKDFYDVYKLLLDEKYDKKKLAEAISATFERRQTKYQSNHILFQDAFTQKSERIRQWKAFLKKSKLDEHLEFEVVMNEITGRLKPIFEGI